MFRKLILIFAIAVLTPVVFSQTVSDPNNEAAEKFEKQVVSLLRETLAEVEGLRLMENRISFASELAGLMRFHDEREARGMYAGVINDFRQLLSGYDAQMNLYAVKPPGEPESFAPFFIGEPTERQRVERKFKIAVTVRQAIATTIAEQDPELALRFYYDSLSALANQDLRRQMESSDRSFEQRLLNQIAAIDPEKAAQLAKKTLERGFNYQQVEVLKKLYDKDVDKAIDLAQSYLGKIKSEKADVIELEAVNSLLKLGTQTFDQSRNAAGRKALYNDTELRDIAEILAQAVLARPNDSGIPFTTYAREVERFQPGRAIQIRAKAQVRTSNRPPPPGARMSANSSLSSVGPNPAAAAAARQRELDERRMFDDLMKIGNEKTTKEQREKIIGQARASIMSMPGRDKKITSLSLLASQVLKTGNKELAAELMRDAASFVNPQPKNYQDFMLTWLLATGYASVEPDRAFPILEETVTRANDLIAAFIKVGEFVDVTEEIISDGEFQVGAFGGLMVRNLIKELGMVDSALEQLSKADFEKLHNITNRFERSEVRVLAKMMVLRAVLKNKQQPAAKTAAKTM